MKRLLSSILFCFGFLISSIAQSTDLDTTFSDNNGHNWKAKVHLPSDYYTATNKLYKLIVFVPGSGEIGGGYAALDNYGPHAYLAGGWNGVVPLGNGNHTPIFVSLEPQDAFGNPDDFPTDGYLQRAVLNNIVGRYRIQPGCIATTGLSAGGHTWKIMVTEDVYDNTPPYGPFDNADATAVICDVQGVQPDDNPDWLNRVQNFARNQYSGQYLGIWDNLDGSRMIPEFSNQMNAAVAGSGRVITTNLGHTASAWNAAYGSSAGAAPTSYTIDGISQTTYQWMLRAMGDTSFGFVSNPPTVTVDALRTITQPINVAALNGTATPDAGNTIVSTTWTVISQPAGANATIRWPDRLTSPLSNSSQLYVCDLENVGTYIIRLTAVDNVGNSASANDTIVVAAETFAPCNPTPKSIILDASTMSGGDQYFPRGTVHPALSGWLPGDTLKVRPRDGSGTPYGLFSIGGLKGNPACPTIIKNDQGLVIINNARLGEYISGQGHTTRLSYFDFRGDGVNGLTYGFKINSADTGRPCIGAALVDHGTIQYIEMTNGAPGLYLKITPDTATANKPYVTFPAYVQRNMKVVHNYVHHTKGEGFYLGDYDRNGDVDHTDINGKRMLPCIGDTLEVAYNVLDSTKWTAVQFTSWRYATMHHNTVTNYGYSNSSSHQAGLAFGGYNTGSIYNNTVSIGTGNAYQIFGYGKIYFYNNTASYSGQQSLFGTDNPDSVQLSAPQQDSVYNNQINYPSTVNGVLRFNADKGVTSNVWYRDNNFCFSSTPPVGWETTYLMSAATTTTRSGNVQACQQIIKFLKTVFKKGKRIKRKQ